jgi:hypothetical protein
MATRSMLRYTGAVDDETWDAVEVSTTTDVHALIEQIRRRRW